MSTRVGGSSSFDYSPETAVHESGEASSAAPAEKPKSEGSSDNAAASAGESVARGTSKAYSQSVKSENDLRANQLQSSLLSGWDPGSTLRQITKAVDDHLDKNVELAKKIGNKALEQFDKDVELGKKIANKTLEQFDKDVDFGKKVVTGEPRLKPTPSEPMPDHSTQVPTQQKVLDGIPPKSDVDDLRQPTPAELQDIRDSIKSGREKEAIEKTMKYYGIHPPSEYKVDYDPQGSTHTDIYEERIVLNKSDFESPERLAAAIQHGAFIANDTPEQHLRSTAYPEADAAMKIKAYDKQLTTGQLNKEQSERVMKERTALYKTLNKQDRELINQLNYDRVPAREKHI